MGKLATTMSFSTKLGSIQSEIRQKKDELKSCNAEYSSFVGSDMDMVTGDCVKYRLPEIKKITKKKLIGHEGPIYALSISDDNFYLISGGEDTTIKLWCLEKSICIINYYAHQDRVWDLNFMHYCFAKSGIYFVSASEDKYAKLWSIGDGKVKRIFRGHKEGVEIAIFH